MAALKRLAIHVVSWMVVGFLPVLVFGQFPSSPGAGGGNPGAMGGFPGGGAAGRAGRPSFPGQPNDPGGVRNRFPGQPPGSVPGWNPNGTPGPRNFGPAVPQNPMTPLSPFGRATRPEFDHRSNQLFPRPAVPVPQMFTRLPSVPTANLPVQWQQAQTFAAQHNLPEARRHVDLQLQQGRNLESMLGAVSLLQQAGANRDMLQPYRQQAMDLARQQAKLNASNSLPWVALARYSLEDNDDQQFRQVTNQFIQQFPQDKHAHFYQGIRELKDGNWRSAEEALRKAQQLGVPAEDINEYLLLAIQGQKWIWEYAQIVLVAIGVWFAGLAGLYVAGAICSRVALFVAGRQTTERVGGPIRLLLRVYRAVVFAAAVYYYVSLPMLVILAIALPLAVGFALLLLPAVTLPLIILVLFLGVGGIVTALTGLRAAFFRVPHDLPGLHLSPDAAPAMWQVVAEVAETVQSRRVEEIRILPDASFAVTETGSFWAQCRDRGYRVLFVGVAALEGLRVDAFKAILAHEYGHFLHRDTAGGDLASHVLASMSRFAEGIVERGKIRWWDVGIHFLRWYHRLFRRLSFGASRLQEVMADRVAVASYGGKQFVEGLRHTIRRSVEFDGAVGKLSAQLIQRRQVAMAFYQIPRGFLAHEQTDIEETIHAILTSPATDQDTHPAPRERFLAAARFPGPTINESSQLVTELMPSFTEYQQRMESQIRDSLEARAQGHRELAQMMVAQLTEQLSQSPTDPGLHFNRACIYLEQGNYQFGLHDLNAVLLAAPQAVEAKLERVYANEELGRLDAAIAELAELLPQSQDPKIQALLHLRLGRLCLSAQHLDAALSHLDQAITLGGDQWLALVLRGTVKQTLGRSADSEIDFDAAVALRPESAEAVRVLRQTAPLRETTVH